MRKSEGGRLSEEDNRVKIAARPAVAASARLHPGAAAGAATAWRPRRRDVSAPPPGRARSHRPRPSSRTARAAGGESPSVGLSARRRARRPRASIARPLGSLPPEAALRRRRRRPGATPRTPRAVGGPRPGEAPLEQPAPVRPRPGLVPRPCPPRLRPELRGVPATLGAAAGTKAAPAAAATRSRPVAAAASRTPGRLGSRPEASARPHGAGVGGARAGASPARLVHSGSRGPPAGGGPAR